MWDEENRIRAIYDDGNVNHYIYDASGERVIKAKSIGQAVFINGEKESASGSVGNYTVYVNPYMVLQSGGYTKHYYIEGQRIVSKLGGGQDKVSQGKAGVDAIDYYTKRKELEQAIVKNLKWVGDDGMVFTAGKSGKVPPGQVKDSGNEAENLQYYYHPDHLGSTSYITDITGEVYQHLEYFAFGETFVEEHSNKNGMPYLFNGKELDEETGLYYYGARYYEAKTSVWLSVDPDTEKYPNLSSFVFVGNNPSNHVDPNGRFFVKHVSVGRNSKKLKTVLRINIYTPQFSNAVSLTSSAPYIGTLTSLGIKGIVSTQDPSVEFGGAGDLISAGLSLFGIGVLKSAKDVPKLGKQVLNVSNHLRENLFTLATLLKEDPASGELALEAFAGHEFAKNKDGVNMTSTGVTIDVNSNYYQSIKDDVIKSFKGDKFSEKELKSAIESEVSNDFQKIKDGLRKQIDNLE
ncbi:RHS repeat domain-containing protein [Marinoscillum sp. MHG1-6]|uniref:RHS repeat domain-containing protein n=1 Tax=Marinoscillum sp. MHG1-6 TaxID=2959627 RepID=UPI002157C68A|nr:RHS repeat-associated core domain-containing protein [Marinoscillum sp. MHG1-6]